MEPITLASSFASVVGLLVSYKAERTQKQDNEYIAFIDWLREKRHEEAIAGIEANQRLATGIRALLNQNNELILERFEKIDELLSRVASQVGDFAEIAASIHPEIELSEQAVSIVQQLVASKASKFMEIKVMTGAPDAYKVIGGAGGDIRYDEPQFIEDDLLTLVELGLLRLEFGSKGTRIFNVTRAAMRLAETV